MKKRSYSKENTNDFKIAPKVSSFKYTPTDNAKSFIIHPQYEKYLKNNKPKPSVVQQQTIPVKTIPVKTIPVKTNKTNNTNEIIPITDISIVKQPVMQSHVLTSVSSPSVSSEKKILKSGFKQNNVNNNSLLKNNVKSFKMSSSVVFYSDINKKKYSKLVDTLFKIQDKKSKKSKNKSNEQIVTLSEEEYKKACQEVERTQKELKQKQERLAIERKKQLELELERQKQLELELERQRQRQIELEKQRQIELEKQRQIELEKQKQIELEKQRQKQIELEKQRQKQIELEKQRQRQIELEKQRQIELEKQRQIELEKQRQFELEKQRQIELEKQKQLELKKQRQAELEKLRQIELENQKQIELETQKRLEIENQRRIRLEQQRQLRLEKQRQLRIEKQRQLELEREKQLENERQKRIEFEKKLELELEKQRKLELERKRQIELEKQRHIEFELERKQQIELELEKQRQIELELEKQRQIELKVEKQLKEKSKTLSPPNIFSTYHTRRSENNKLKKNIEKNIEKNNLSVVDSVKQNEVSTKPAKASNIPKVTIIVPMYNVELYITNCALSLVNQSYSNIEILLVNDCSTDNTKKIADSLMEKYPDKIKVLHNPRNVGTYISINIGIINSTGKYITIIGADDQFTPDKIARQAALLERNKKIVACYCQYERQHYKTKKVLVKDVGESTIMFKRAIINKIGYYDSVRFGADSEYRDRIKAVYGTTATSVIKRVMYLALFRPNSLTASGKSRNGSTLRVKYRQNYLAWHRRRRNLHVGFPMKKRPFPVPKELI